MANVGTAHLGHQVSRAERYLKIDAATQQVRVVVSLSLGAAEAETVLRAADRDGNGDLTRIEADAYLAGWAAELKRELPIAIDGETLTPDFRDGAIDPIGELTARPTLVELVAHVPIDAGSRTVTVRDGMDIARFDRTDVAFRSRDGVRLVAAGFGPDPRGIERDVSYGAEARGAVLTAQIEVPEKDAEAWWPWAILGGFLALPSFWLFSGWRSARRPAGVRYGP